MTTSSPNPASYVTCTDSPLSKAASIISILTFAYAILVGIALGVARFERKVLIESPRELHELAESLVGSLIEAESAAHLLKIVLDEGAHCDQESEELRIQAKHILNRSDVQLGELNSIISRYSDKGYPSKRSVLQQFGLSTRFVLQKPELEKKMRKKDELMADLRHLQEKARVL